MARTENEFVKDLFDDINQNYPNASEEEINAVIRKNLNEYMKEVSAGSVDPSLIEYLNDVSEENMKKIITEGVKNNHEGIESITSQFWVKDVV